MLRFCWISLAFAVVSSLAAATTLRATTRDGKSPPDFKKMQQQCDQDKVPAACVFLGEQAWNGGDLRVAQGWFRKACDEGIASACSQSAQAWVALGEKESALRDYNRACSMPADDGTACMAMASMAIEAQGKDAAQRWYGKACNKGHQPGCDAQRAQKPAKP